MIDERRIQELLEEALDSERTADEVCADTPELLPLMRARLAHLKSVDAELKQLFPERSAEGAPFASVSDDYPSIPGYEIQSLLGRGGMGVVYRARHARLDRVVALKMMLAGIYATPQESARFQREARAAASLRSANIVQVFEIGEYEGRPYFTMELVEGGSLAQSLTGTPRAARKAAALLSTLARAVHVAHQGGIVHRDLKPSNILLAADGTPKISDFGLARHIEGGSAVTLTGARVGTPSYMAPEQARGDPTALHPAVDVYALGSILYETLTGRPPFRAETSLETQRQVLIEEPVPPSRLNPSLPRDMETICLTCLHKDPARRYASAAALADDLDRFLRDEPIAARPVGRIERTAKWIRRHPTRATLLSVSILAVALASSVLISSNAQRVATAQAVEEDLRTVSDRERALDWAAARTALERAKIRFGDGGPNDLRARVANAEHELDLVQRLGGIRFDRAALLPDSSIDVARGDREYFEAFGTAGFGSIQANPAEFSARLSATGIRTALVAALDDWAVCAQDPKRREWVLEVARHADPDPVWRDRARDPKLWADIGALKEFVGTVPVDNEFTSLLVALAERIAGTDGDATDFLLRLQRWHPDDFWANLHTAKSLLRRGDAAAVGYYRAALALRPNSGAVSLGLARALNEHSHKAEGVEVMKHLVEIDPASAIARFELAMHLRNTGRHEEAEREFKEAVRLDPSYSAPHKMLGLVAMTRGDLGEAIEETRRCLELEPSGSPLRAVAEKQLHGLEELAAAEKRLPGALDGEEEYAPPEDLLRFGWLCGASQRYADALRFYALAFEREPALRDSVGRGARFGAAVTAIKGGAEFSDAAFTAEERARFRDQGLQWLKDELEGYSKLVASGDAKARAEARIRLNSWQDDPTLAAVRESDALARLPEVEREPWREFWGRVAAILDRAR